MVAAVECRNSRSILRAETDYRDISMSKSNSLRTEDVP
jgi:hypothetical protein